MRALLFILTKAITLFPFRKEMRSSLKLQELTMRWCTSCKQPTSYVPPPQTQIRVFSVTLPTFFHTFKQILDNYLLCTEC